MNKARNRLIFMQFAKSIGKITKKEIFILCNLPIDLTMCIKTSFKY